MANTIVILFLEMAIPTPWISLSDYHYELPENRIAKYPTAVRDESKLLVWKDGVIKHEKFNQLSDYLPVNSTLFFNNTKVIPARLLFEKETGAAIEVFLLAPANTTLSLALALDAKGSSTWKCAVGNSKRWPEQVKLNKTIRNIELSAAWKEKELGLVTFSWMPAEIPFSEIIGESGVVPLPPYLKREAEALDRERYQTVYSHHEGAVAAPTAGLHFTPNVLEQLGTLGIQTNFLTLHVSAGTFLPIKSENAADHRIHEEELVIHKSNIISLLQENRRFIAVGTTALRTLESLYWFGVILSTNPTAPFSIDQDFPYNWSGDLPTTRQALEFVLSRMQRDKVEELTGHTSIYIMPGYQFRIIHGLITNFHQPGSTLLVLISALIGGVWKQVYQEALDKEYRFLSYGDSSLLLPITG